MWRNDKLWENNLTENHLVSLNTTSHSSQSCEFTGCTLFSCLRWSSLRWRCLRTWLLEAAPPPCSLWNCRCLWKRWWNCTDTLCCGCATALFTLYQTVTVLSGTNIKHRCDNNRPGAHCLKINSSVDLHFDTVELCALLLSFTTGGLTLSTHFVSAIGSKVADISALWVSCLV